MNRNIRTAGYVLLSAGIAVYLYILLHEAGHAAVLLSTGAAITDFSVFTAHVGADCGVETNLSKMWMHANGVLLPFLVSNLYLILYRKSSSKSFYRIFSYIAVIVAPCSMLAWVVIPFAYLQGNAPANGDVTQFMDIFCENYHPLLVSAAAAALIGMSLLLMIKKRVVHNFIEEIRQK